jgi:hypothetical protein
MNTLPVTSLASLKRAIATPNIIIYVEEHWQENLAATSRVPSRIQTNGYWFYGLNRQGERKEMWAPTPKASELRFNPDGTVTYYPDTPKSWRLRFEVKP